MVAEYTATVGDMFKTDVRYLIDQALRPCSTPLILLLCSVQNCFIFPHLSALRNQNRRKK